MPGGDRTGPRGMGPMTGRGLGYCAGYSSPAYSAPGYAGGRGWGGGGWGGGGRGWRHWYYATGLPGWARAGYSPGWTYPPYQQPMPEEQETELLRNQAEALGRELEAITKRLEELEKKA